LLCPIPVVTAVAEKDVRSCHDVKRILLNTPSAAFTESKPGWLTAPPAPPSAPAPAAGVAPAPANRGAPVTNAPDSPQYLAWKKFPVGTKVTYENRLYTEVQPGTQQYARQRISQTTFQLQLVDADKASVTATKTTWDPRGGVNHSSNDLTYRAKEVAPPMELPGNPPPEKIQTTRGEETLVISGKSIHTDDRRDRAGALGTLPDGSGFGDGGFRVSGFGC
jgi:hypothetical protein